MYESELLKRYRPLFYPGSIAIIGASRDTQKRSNLWIRRLTECGYKGKIFPIGSGKGSIHGHEVYNNINDTPSIIDYANVFISREALPAFMKDLSPGKVRFMSFFTAGFSEYGDSRGIELEQLLLNAAKEKDFHIIGPNCIGVYNPALNIPYGPAGIIGKGGHTGFISQSGSVGAKLVETGIARGIGYNKGISYGNGIDLDSTDFLEYMAVDPEIEVIGAYLEGTRKGRDFVRTMKLVTGQKPVVIWKGGRTDAGASTAMSHTGSIASPAANWSAVLKQSGAIEVYSIEELTDTLLIFQQLKRWNGSGIALIGGFVDGGGGICVSATDTFADYGLHIPSFCSETQNQLGDLLGSVVNIMRNPVDLAAQGSNIPLLRKALQAVIEDPSVDMLVAQQDMGILMLTLSPETIEAINDTLINLRIEQHKPIVAVMPPGLHETLRQTIEDRLSENGIPVFSSLERAARAIRHINKYSLSHRGNKAD
ncbi:MAG: CoA-binding protein [Dehalococcoidia bacterium]